MGKKLVMGANGEVIKCPQCGSTNLKVTDKWISIRRNDHRLGRCGECGAKWEIVGTR